MLRNFIFLTVVLVGTPSLLAQQRVDFVGNRVFSSGALLDKLNACIAKSQDPDSKNAEHIRSYCLEVDVRRFMWSQGYMEAKISVLKDPNGDRSLNVVVSVNEGIRYRLGNVKIKGSEAFTPEQLREKLTLRTGDIADGKVIQDWVFDKLKDLYGDTGHVQYTADFDPVFRRDPANPTEGIVDLDVTVEEGRQFTLRNIEFNGNRCVRDRALRDAMVMNAGDIFSQKLFNESIKKINELGLLEHVDKDKDVDFLVDKKTFDVDVKLRVAERADNNCPTT